MVNETARRQRRGGRVEWPTLALLAATYLGLGGGDALRRRRSGPGSRFRSLAVVLAQHSSLQHETIHGHPTRARAERGAGLSRRSGSSFRYRRFRDLHLAHHYDPLLTDPHDDPESNYLDPAVWARLRRPVRALLAANNTLLGRMLIGPFLGIGCLWRDDLARGARRRPRRARGPGRTTCAALVPVGALARLAATMPLWQYLARLLGGAVDPADPHLPRAPGARAGGGAERDHRGPRAAVDPVPQQQLPRGAPRQPAAALVPAAGGVRPRGARSGCGGTAAMPTAPTAEVFGRYLFARKDPVAHPIWTAAEPQPGASRIRSPGGRCAHDGRARRPADVRLARGRATPPTALWAALRDGLRPRGIAGAGGARPRRRADGGVDAIPGWCWGRPAACRSCANSPAGWRWSARPTTALPGCPPGWYRSAVVVRADDPRETLAGVPRRAAGDQRAATRSRAGGRSCTTRRRWPRRAVLRRVVVSGAHARLGAAGGGRRGGPRGRSTR